MKGLFKKVSLVLAICGLAALSTGCASIVKGGTQTVQIKSTPSAAAVKVIDMNANEEVEFSGITPATVNLQKGAGMFKSGKYKVVIEKENYQPYEVILEGTASGWYLAGNLVFGGLIGWIIVDPATGAMWNLTPAEVDGTLTSNDTASADTDTSIIVALKENVDNSLLTEENKIK